MIVDGDFREILSRERGRPARPRLGVAWPETVEGITTKDRAFCKIRICTWPAVGSRGALIHTKNREHGLHHAGESGKTPDASLKGGARSRAGGGSPPRVLQGFFTWMHRMHRIFSGNGWLAILSIRKPAPDHRPSRLPVQKPLVLCILCIHVHKKYRFPGAVAVRSKWQRWPGLCRAWCGRDARAPGGHNPSRHSLPHPEEFAKGSSCQLGE